jgi:hypothetical protein
VAVQNSPEHKNKLIGISRAFWRVFWGDKGGHDISTDEGFAAAIKVFNEDNPST